MRAAIVLMVLAVATPAEAQFAMDIPAQQFRREVGRLAVSDIAIGEAALTDVLRICTVGGRLMLDASIPIATTQSDYGVSYRVRREPNNMASLESVVGSKAGNSAKTAALNALARATMLDCALFATPPENFFQINEIDGKKSLTDFLKAN